MTGFYGSQTRWLAAFCVLFTRKSVSGINSIEDLSDVGPDSFLSKHVFKEFHLGRKVLVEV